MAYRKTASRRRAPSRSRSYSRPSGRRTSRRSSGGRSARGGGVIRLVIEQPAANVAARPELVGLTAAPTRKRMF